MPREIVLTALSNRIEYATTNGKGVITGKREDITDAAIRAVTTHLKTGFDRTPESTIWYGYTFEDAGSLLYFPPGTDLEKIRQAIRVTP